MLEAVFNLWGARGVRPVLAAAGTIFVLGIVVPAAIRAIQAR